MTQYKDHDPDWMPWWQWLLVWLGLSTFGFFGTMFRTHYVDDVPWRETLAGGLGAIGLFTFVVFGMWGLSHYLYRPPTQREKKKLR